jgi:hypothetical protein
VATQRIEFKMTDGWHSAGFRRCCDGRRSSMNLRCSFWPRKMAWLTAAPSARYCKHCHLCHGDDLCIRTTNQATEKLPGMTRGEPSVPMEASLPADSQDPVSFESVPSQISAPRHVLVCASRVGFRFSLAGDPLCAVQDAERRRPRGNEASADYLRP